MKNNSRPVLAYLALAAVCIIWGTTYLALRVGVTQFPPFLFSMIRFLIAGPILIGLILTVGKASLPSRKVMVHQAVAGLLMVTLGIGVVGWSEKVVSSGLAAIICSMMPIWVIFINLRVNREDRPTFPIILGFLVGLSGIILIFGEHLSEFSNPAYYYGIIMTFAANFCWALGSVWMKKKNENSDPFINAGLQMFFGGIFLIPLTLVFDDYSSVHWSGGMLSALVYLILIGSVAAYACYAYAIKKLPMTLVSLYAYINPIVAVILGWMVLDERLNGRIMVAILITVAGIYVVNRGYQLRDFWKAQFSKLKSDSVS